MMWCGSIKLIAFVALQISVISGAKILIYHGALASYSHRASTQPLANALALRGHNVTIFGPITNPHSHPSIRTFCPKELREFNRVFLEAFGTNGFTTRVGEKFQNDLLSGTTLADSCFKACQSTFDSPDMIEWIRSNSFDVLILDNVCNECAYGLAKYWNSKLILFGTFNSLLPWDFDIYSVPAENSWIPGLSTNYDGEMGLIERIRSTFGSLYWGIMFRKEILPRYDSYIGGVYKKLGVELPPVLELMKGVDLILLNVHYSDAYPRPFPPFIVPIGGISLYDGQEQEGLSKGIENFLQGSDFIYVSFGSALKVSALPAGILEIFYKAFENLNGKKILWKWDESEIPRGAPKNIFFQRWFQQLDLIGIANKIPAHAQLKAFVTHGGHISFQQALCNGVPLMIFPVTGDQDLTAKRIRHLRNGVEMEFANLTLAYMEKSLEKLLHDNSIQERAKSYVSLCRDRPMNPVETAVWWTEYVLRTKDLSFLKPGSLEQSWWIYRGLDVYAILFFVIYVVIPLILYILFRLFRKYSFKPSESVEGGKKRN